MYHTTGAQDNEATNGVVHVLDTVLFPCIPPFCNTKDIVQTAAATPDLSTLVTALNASLIAIRLT